jgi:tetratricopeptide (TPR) repeat protein
VSQELEPERDLMRARGQLAMGDLHGAVETLRRVLGQAPDHALAHSLLAAALLRQHRLHAARYEAKIGLELDVESGTAHEILARVYVAERKFVLAAEHIDRAIELAPEEPSHLLAKAMLHELQGKRDDALAALKAALALDPEDPDILIGLADNHLGRGKLDEAERYARAALEIQPDHGEGLVTMGQLLLRRGRVEEARDHAIWALASDPSSRSALVLLASVKARQSLLLGTWWRFSAWLGGMADGRIVLVLLGAYVLQRTGTIYALDHGQPRTAQLVSYAWLAICIYSWMGPGLFRRSLERELGKVQLDERF